MTIISTGKTFTAPLTVTQLDAERWQTEREFQFYVDDERSEIVTVPLGTITDFYSVPFPVSMMLPKSEKGNQAAVLHDFLYSKACQLDYTRKHCDDIFLLAMKALGINFFKRQLIYWNVRMFGGQFFRAK